jgi:hypothetical protein
VQSVPAARPARQVPQAVASGAMPSSAPTETPRTERDNGAPLNPFEEEVGPPETMLFPQYSQAESGSQQALDAEEGFVLSRIAERCTVRELLQMAGTGRERTYEILWKLIRKGYVTTQRRG